MWYNTEKCQKLLEKVVDIFVKLSRLYNEVLGMHGKRVLHLGTLTPEWGRTDSANNYKSTISA